MAEGMSKEVKSERERRGATLRSVWHLQRSSDVRQEGKYEREREREREGEREREISRAAAMFVLMSFQKHDAFCLLLVFLLFGRAPRGGGGDPHPVRIRGQ